MGLTPEQIKFLLNKASQPKSRGRKPKNYVDTSIRDIVTWFKLGQKLMDDETGEPAKCSNPNCSDTRTSHMVVHVNGVNMCRRCFLDEYQMVDETEEAVLNDGD